MPKQSTAASSRRAKVIAAQAAQARAQRTKRLLIALAILVAVGMIVVIIGVLINHQRKATAQNEINGPGIGAGSPSGSAHPAQITPPNASPDGMAIIGNPSVTTAALTLNIHLDYQCPICKNVETALGHSLETLAANGDISLQYNIHTFLDQGLGNTASTRAAIAATCADTISPGTFQAYHDVVYADQPAKEGTGYTDDQLRSTFAAEAGITGNDLTTFQTCYDNRQTSSFVAQMNQKNGALLSSKYTDAKGNYGTPTLIANGVQVNLSTVTPDMTTDPAALLALLKSTAGIA